MDHSKSQPMPKKLQDEQNFLNAVLDNAGALVVVLDREGRIRRFNRACEELSQYAFAEVEGKFPWDIFLATEERDTVHAEAFLALAEHPERSHGSYSNYWVTKAGEERLIEWSNTVLFDAHGAMEFMVSIGTDVTEKYQVAQALRASEARYRSVIATMAEGIVVMGADMQIVAFNVSALNILGLSEDQLRGRTSLDPNWRSIHEDGSPFPGETHPALVSLRTGQSFSNVIMGVHRPDGSFAWISINSAPLIREGEQQPSGSVASFTDITERRQAMHALEKSESLFRTLAKVAPVGIFRTNSSGDCTFVNEPWCEMAGLSQETALGSGWSEAIHPEDRARVFEQWTQAASSQLPFLSEYRFQQPDGQTVWVVGQARAEESARGEVLGYVGTITNITELKRTEAEMLATTARLNEAQRIAQVGSWELDLVSGELIWSDEIFRLFEIDKTVFGATYEAFLNAIHPEDRDLVNQAYSDSVASRKPYEIAHRLRMPDGRIKWVNECCETIYDDCGKALRSMGTVQDVTEQKRMDEELRRHREHLEELVQERTAELRQAQRIGHMGNWTLNLASGGLSWSDEIFRIFGHQPGAFSPTFERFIASVHPADVESLNLEIQAACADGLHHSIDHRIRLPDGEVRWVNESGIAAFDENGNPISLSGTVQDITERKQVEQAMLEAKEAAERANRAKSEFLSRMSHELRTPMNAILGFSQLLKMDALTPDQQDFVHEIHQAGDHLLELINELLDLARIEAGRLPTAVKATPLRPLTEQAVQLIQPLLQKMEVTLLNQCGHDVNVLADPTRLKQVLVNLLSNAAKYNRQGGSICIGCELLDDERLRLSVTDGGAGIAPENLGLLFQPFERLGVSELTAIEGTGIGLAISKRLIELMGGTIGAESTPGKGSTFWIELPLAHSPQLAAAAPTALPQESAGKCSVLYVEDNAANLRVVEAMLRHRPDLTLLSASNGEYGLELAQRYLPQVILLDIHLPGMDGYAVLKQLQDRPETRDIPVIALSADAMPLDVERGLAAGFRRYLTKPVKIQDLLEAIEQTTAVHETKSLSDLS
jgi:PAS domain S-box-containing protein